jgi:hypothetical protein
MRLDRDCWGLVIFKFWTYSETSKFLKCGISSPLFFWENGDLWKFWTFYFLKILIWVFNWMCEKYDHLPKHDQSVLGFVQDVLSQVVFALLRTAHRWTDFPHLYTHWPHQLRTDKKLHITRMVSMIFIDTFLICLWFMWSSYTSMTLSSILARIYIYI